MRVGLSSGLYIGSLLGIAIRVHWSFLLLPFLSGGEGFGRVKMLLYLALFGTVLIHELGHCLAARSVGGQAHQIVLWPLGGLAFVRANKGHTLQSIWVSLAGPLTHIPLAAACAAILASVGHPVAWSDLNPLGPFHFPASEVWHNMVYVLFKMQVLLFCFNVFTPAYPMDGGQVVAAVLSNIVPLSTCSFIMAGLTFGSAVMLAQHDLPFLAVFLGANAFSLLGPASDWHPLAAFYARPGVIEGRSPIFVAPGLNLKPCPQCHQPLHPAAERCAYCDTLYPFGQSQPE
ncbi:M50 family metallopeptidase [bacterium]|nr:M50 family metallopeptidase [bacterium]